VQSVAPASPHPELSYSSHRVGGGVDLQTPYPQPRPECTWGGTSECATHLPPITAFVNERISTTSSAETGRVHPTHEAEEQVQGKEMPQVQGDRHGRHHDPTQGHEPEQVQYLRL